MSNIRIFDQVLVVPGISIVIEDISVSLVVHRSEFAQALDAIPLHRFLAVQLYLIVTVHRKFLLRRGKDLNLLASTFFKVKFKCWIHFVYQGCLPLYDEE